jgi:methyl-accepting chemotaxis protein
MKLATKMLLGTALLALAPVVITSYLVGGGAAQLSRESLTDAVTSQLTALREVRKQQVSTYVTTLSRSLEGLAANATVIEGFKSLRDAFNNPADLPKPDVVQKMGEELKDAYLKEFTAEFAKRNATPATGVEALLAALTPTQIALQHAFVTANANLLGAKNRLVDATERSAFSAVHSRVHPSIEAFREKMGFYDIFLIDPQTDRIVYTAFKELDFTSSLADGPSAKSGLGDVYRKIKAAGKAGTVAFSDYAPYFLSYNDEAAFMAVALMDGERMVGVLAAQVPLSALSSLMTAGSNWRAQGLGDTGETFLIGADSLMRTDSRFLLEDKAAFLKSLEGRVSTPLLAQADKKVSTIGIVKVESDAAREALAGNDGFQRVNDYRGEPVFSAYGPLEVLGVKMAVLAQIEESEALSAANALRDRTTVRTALAASGVLFFAAIAGYLFVRTITRPVNDLSVVVKQVAEGNDEVRSKVQTGDELQELGDTFNKLLDDRIAVLSKSKAENEALNDSVVGLLQTMFELSGRNLAARATVTTDIVGTVADSVNMLAIETSGALTRVSHVASEVSDSSRRVSSSSQALSAQAGEDRAQIEAMNRDIQQTSNLMQQVAGLADQSREAASQATATTSSALKAVTSTVGEMAGIRESIAEMEKRVKRLGERSQEISQIVSVINSISERTHVLALNASMQAAMAGEAGRGFAVVTEEVQRLADSSRSATMQIGQLAQNIQLETTETVAALNRTVTEVVKGTEVAESSGVLMRETEAATSRLSEAVQRIADESVRQIALARQLADRAAAISRSSQQTQQVVASTATDAATLAGSSARLVEVVSEFKLAEEVA